MPSTLVLIFIADDRPGLVEKLSEAVSGQGGNWLESRMSHLAGKFAGIARIEVPEEKIASFRAAIQALEAEGFHLTIEQAAVDEPQVGSVLTLDLVGSDHPGIVRDISSCLADRGVSVEEMETDIREAPMGGGTLFYARIRARAPVDLSDEDLRADLERLSATLMIDITLREELLAPHR